MMALLKRSPPKWKQTDPMKWMKQADLMNEADLMHEADLLP